MKYLLYKCEKCGREVIVKKECSNRMDGVNCRKCGHGIFDVTPTNTLPSPVTNQRKGCSIGSLKVDVGINGMDETIKQLQGLKELYADIDTLQQRIIRSAERVEQTAGRRHRASELCMKVNREVIDDLARFECQDIILTIANIMCASFSEEDKAAHIEKVLIETDVIAR